MKQIKQFRYYHSTSDNNYPTGYSSYSGMLVNGNIFDNLGPISHIGIQGVPGTKFYLNESQYPIEIGYTGIYELDLGGYGHIYAIRFDKTDLQTKYTNTNSARLFIDIVYEGGTMS